MPAAVAFAVVNSCKYMDFLRNLGHSAHLGIPFLLQQAVFLFICCGSGAGDHIAGVHGSCVFYWFCTSCSGFWAAVAGAGISLF